MVVVRNNSDGKSKPKTSLKQNARYKSHGLVKKGILIKPEKCEKCGTKPLPYVRANGTSVSSLQMHHSDYGKPENVTWLCMECHHKLHGQNFDLKKLNQYMGQKTLWLHNAYKGLNSK